MTFELPKMNALEQKPNPKNGLGVLDSPTRTTEVETISRMSETEDPSKENKTELSEFSKRYAAFYRKQISQRIRSLRAQYGAKLQDKPREIESINSSDCEDFTKRRVGEDGKFQYLDEDVPLEVRKKLKTL